MKRNSSRENIGLVNLRHGMYKTKVYTAWLSMMNRCNNPNATRFEYYGARGITVCKRWLRFDEFFEDMGNPPSKEFSLDRIDSNKNYEPGNCRWATKQQQSSNRRNCLVIEFGGERKTAAEWSRITGIPRQTIANRLKAGLPSNLILTKGNIRWQGK